MKILIVHNSYKVKGGEDSVVANEVAMLRIMGHEVVVIEENNNNIEGLFSKVLTFFNSIWSVSGYSKLIHAVKTDVYDIVHVHNFFPKLSPSIFGAIQSCGVPVVHTLHNYRTICPTALLMHKGEVCEKSINKNTLWAVKERVYRNSYAGSIALCLMIEFHKYLGTWQKSVDKFISLTEFQKNKFVEAGWSKEKLAVKPNFTPTDCTLVSNACSPRYAGFFLGRLSEEKGIQDLLDAQVTVSGNLKVAGTGPELALVSQTSEILPTLDYLGSIDKEQVIKEMLSARFLVMASTWYEGFPMVLVEAFSCGTPAIVPKLGSMAEIVEDGVTGLHFEPGNAEDLARKMQYLHDNPDLALEMGISARNKFLVDYTEEANYKCLMEIYNEAIEEASSK